MAGSNFRFAEQATNRALMDAALRWGVNPQRATHNPVFWKDGRLNYYDPVSHREDIFEYLEGRGILSLGFNRAFKLDCGLDRLEEVADMDYERGIEIDVVVGHLVAQLCYQHGELFYNHERGSNDAVKESERTSAILEYLCELGFIEQTRSDVSRGYKWTKKADPILKRHYL